MATFDEQQIKISGRLLAGIVVQTATVVAMGVGFYFALKSDIRNVSTEKNDSDKYWQLKFDQIQLQNQAFQKQLDGIQNRIDQWRGEQNLKNGKTDDTYKVPNTFH